MFPAGIITREVEVGPVFDLVSGAPYEIRVMVSPSRTLTWNGSPAIPSLRTYIFAADESGTIELPVTDQSGYRDGAGNLISLDVGEHSHFYNINIVYLRNGSVASKKTPMRVLLPEGVGAVDIDEMVYFNATAAGGLISTPDVWSTVIAAAQAAAVDAAESAEAAEQAVTGFEGNVGAAVDAWFEDNSNSIISPSILESALDAHREEATPHKAYDLDIPSLTVLFENGLA